MKSEVFVRVLAGLIILLSLTLAVVVHLAWLGLTAFVALNLIQSAFTGFCPPEWLAHRLGWVHRAGDRLPISQR